MPIGIGNRDVLCLDWDERSLRVLEASMSRSGVTVRRAANVPVPSGLDVRDASAMGDFLRRALGEHRIRARRAIVDVPRQDTVLNRLSLPTGTTDELAAMVHLQIVKELPFSKDQAVIDFAVVPQQGKGTCDVWVAAIRTNIIEYYRQVMSHAGLDLERIGLRPYANVKALQATGHTEGRVVMVDIGPSMTEINILRDGALMYTRAASVTVPAHVALDDQEDAADAGAVSHTPPVGSATTEVPLDNLLIEVNRTIAAYRATDLSASFERMVIAGTAGGAEMAEAFQERFGTATELYEAPKSLRWRGSKEISAAPFSAAIGLALGNLAEGIEYFDFLHVKEPEAEHRERAKRRPMVVAVIALFSAAALAAAYQPIRSLSAQIDSLKGRVEQANQDAKRRTQILKIDKDLTGWRTDSVVWIDYLRLLAEVFPSNQECYVTKLDFRNSNDTMVIYISAVDPFVAGRAVEAITSVRDAKGKQIFDARSGNKTGATKDPKYPVSDELHVRVLVRPTLPKPQTAPASTAPASAAAGDDADKEWDRAVKQAAVSAGEVKPEPVPPPAAAPENPPSSDEDKAAAVPDHAASRGPEGHTPPPMPRDTSRPPREMRPPTPPVGGPAQRATERPPHPGARPTGSPPTLNRSHSRISRPAATLPAGGPRPGAAPAPQPSGANIRR